MTLQEIDAEIERLSKKIEELDLRIAADKPSGDIKSLSCRLDIVTRRAFHQHMRSLRQERNYMAKKLKELSPEEARELKVPTFKHHFYYAAKDLLEQEDFKRIKDEARSRLDAELESRGFTA